MTASLCKWDNYRRSPDPGLFADIPETKPGSFGSTYKLADVSPIAPYGWCPNSMARVRPDFTCARRMVGRSGFMWTSGT
jgi:hypothetical protein